MLMPPTTRARAVLASNSAPPGPFGIASQPAGIRGIEASGLASTPPPKPQHTLTTSPRRTRPRGPTSPTARKYQPKGRGAKDKDKAPPPVSDADPPDLDSQSTARVLTLNCWVVGEHYSSIFPIKIENTQNVMEFRERVKEKKAIAFGRVDANNIDLWRVSAPIQLTSELPEHVQKSGILMKESLPPMALLSDIFPEPLVKNNLHVVVQAESGNQGENCFSGRIAANTRI